MSRSMERSDGDHEAFAELAAAFALDALDDVDAARFRTHLATCEQCWGLVAEYRAVTRLLPETLAERSASPGLRHRILEAAQAERAGSVRPTHAAARARPRRMPVWLLPLAALLVLTALAGYRSFQLQAQLEDQRTTLRLQEQVLAAVAAGARTWPLTGTEQAPQASGVLVQAPGEPRPLLLVRSLPDLPPDRAYQVWVISGGTPFEAGLLSPGRDGVQVARLDRPAGNADTVALTIEPAGGSRAPTGPIVIAGQV